MATRPAVAERRGDRLGDLAGGPHLAGVGNEDSGGHGSLDRTPPGTPPATAPILHERTPGAAVLCDAARASRCDRTSATAPAVRQPGRLQRCRAGRTGPRRRRRRRRRRRLTPARVRRWLAAAPSYEPNAADLRTVDVLGLRLPGRATLAVVAVALILLLDYHGRIDGLVAAVLGPSARERPTRSGCRRSGGSCCEGLVPLLLVVLVMRDRPSRYGVAIGDWRAGVALAIGGCMVMTPVAIGAGAPGGLRGVLRAAGGVRRAGCS